MLGQLRVGGVEASEFIYLSLRVLNNWQYNYLHYTSMISRYFSCCDNSPSADNSECSDSYLPRKIVSKNKTCNTLISPKSSLRALAAMRNQKDPKESSSSANIHLLSTVDLANPTKVKSIQSTSSSAKMHNDRIVEVPIRPNLMKPPSPSPVCYMAPSPKVRKQIINFTYKSPNNPEKCPPPALISLNHSHIKLEKINTETEKQEIVQPPEPRNSSHVINNNQKAKQNDLSPLAQINNPDPIRPKFKLGGSKFTILSEEGAEESLDHPRLEESTIIFNVFNPRKSQINRWPETQTRKTSFQQAINWQQ